MEERVIWERTVDESKIDRRRRNFMRVFVGPALAGLLLAVIFLGWQNAIGVAIVLSFVGGLAGLWVKYSALSERANPTIVVANNQIMLGRASAPIDQIAGYTAFASSIQTSLFGSLSRIAIGKAIFRLGPDPDNSDSANSDPDNSEHVEFAWPKMDDAGIETVKHALAAELPGLWIAPEDFFPEPPIARPVRPGQRRRP